jgi:hypothetical protein
VASRSSLNTIVPGCRVTLRKEAVDRERLHLYAHAARGDTGTVLEPRRGAWPGWIHVRFDGCPSGHLVAETEIVLSQAPKK